MGVATPVSSLVAGLIAGGSLEIARHFKPVGFYYYFVISMAIVCSASAFFYFVVRDGSYEFKIWYGLNEMSVPRVVRGGAWLIGVTFVVLVTEAF